MKKEEKIEWLRVLEFILSLGWLIVVRSKYLEYRKYEEYFTLGIFDLDWWIDAAAGVRLSIAYDILMSAFFGFQFITFHWDKSSMKYILSERIFFTTALVIWVCLPFLTPLPRQNGLWAFTLIALLAYAIYALYKLVNRKEQEEDSFM